MAIRRVLGAVVLGAATMGILAACTIGPVTYTVPAGSIAKEAENIFEAEVGSRPAVDCGEAEVKLVDGTELECVLTDPATDIRYPAYLTISEVDGTNYRLSVEGGSEPLE